MKPIIDAVRAGKLVCIVGPTASGKTELAVRVAEEVGGEIVSADSIQVYRRFDIGSGKPTEEEKRRAPHHLIDVRDPLDPMDAARFVTMADEAIDAIRSKNKVPIVCGGTFLWVKALTSGLASAPPADVSIRQAHRALVSREGRNALYARLSAVDPKAAARLHPNDVVRVSRALEVFELTGETITSVQEKHAFRTRRYDAALFAVAIDPEELRTRIEKRTDAWLEAGWIDHVRALVADGFSGARAMSSVGFKEIFEALPAAVDRDALRTKIVQHTRIFARRQRTWLNHEPVTWVGRR